MTVYKALYGVQRIQEKLRYDDHYYVNKIQCNTKHVQWQIGNIYKLYQHTNDHVRKQNTRCSVNSNSEFGPIL